MDPLIPVVAALLSGGFVGALVAFYKAGPERESISVETLRGVIVELRHEVSRLADENKLLREQVEKLETRVAELDPTY